MGEAAAPATAPSWSQQQTLGEGAINMAHSARLGGPFQRHRRLFDVLEGLVALIVLCGLLAGGAALATLLAVRVLGTVLHSG